MTMFGKCFTCPQKMCNYNPLPCPNKFALLLQLLCASQSQNRFHKRKNFLKLLKKHIFLMGFIFWSFFFAIFLSLILYTIFHRNMLLLWNTFIVWVKSFFMPWLFYFSLLGNPFSIGGTFCCFVVLLLFLTLVSKKNKKNREKCVFHANQGKRIFLNKTNMQYFYLGYWWAL